MNWFKEEEISRLLNLITNLTGLQNVLILQTQIMYAACTFKLQSHKVYTLH